jgi:GntR family transcriptional regulator
LITDQTYRHQMTPMVERPVSLYLFLKNQLEELISNSEFKPGDKLPSEYELARKYKVSRMTLRESLRGLEEEGFVVRKQGLGTFVKTNSHRIRSILDINYGVTEMIKSMGFTPGTREMDIKEVVADSHTAKMLDVNEGSILISIERVRTADKKPVVYSFERMPAWVIDSIGIGNIIGLEGSLYEFLEQKCNITISSSMARLFPTKATRKLAKKLEVKADCPLFLLEQTDTNQSGKSILYSLEHFVTEYFDFVIYRRPRKYKLNQ